MAKIEEYFLPYREEEPTGFGCHVGCIGHNCDDTVHDNRTNCYQYRNDYQIIFIHEGAGRVQLGGTWYTFGGNTLILYRPMEYQRYEITYHSEYDIYWLYLEKLPEDALNRFGIPDGSLFHVTEPDCVKSVLDTMMTEAGRDPENGMLLSMYAGVLLSYIARTVTPFLMKPKLSADVPDTEMRIRMIIGEIEENYRLNVEIKEYASRISLNTGYFIEVFRQFTGRTPLAYRTMLRMEKAKQLLTDTQKPVHEIAAEIGYMDSMYFSKQFRKYTGLTPVIYRRNTMD